MSTSFYFFTKKLFSIIKPLKLCYAKVYYSTFFVSAQGSLLAQRNVGLGANADGLGIQLGYKLSDNFFIKSSYSNIALNIDDIDLSTDQAANKAESQF